jgi:hypothetical protein
MIVTIIKKRRKNILKRNTNVRKQNLVVAAQMKRIPNRTGEKDIKDI